MYNSLKMLSVTLKDGTTIYSDNLGESYGGNFFYIYEERNFVEALKSGKCDALAISFSRQVASLDEYKNVNNNAFISSEMANYMIENLSDYPAESLNSFAENLNYSSALAIKILKEGFDCVTFDPRFEGKYASLNAEGKIEVHTLNESDYQDAASFLAGIVENNPEL